jgi:hypothetical protein
MKGKQKETKWLRRDGEKRTEVRSGCANNLGADWSLQGISQGPLHTKGSAREEQMDCFLQLDRPYTKYTAFPSKNAILVTELRLI